MKRGLDDTELTELGAPGDICQFFAKAGWCKHAENCKYVHEGGPEEPVGVPGSSGELCQFFVKAGWCKHGDICRHVHEGGPDEPIGKPSQTGEVCQFFEKTGWCKHGDDCRHVHVGGGQKASGKVGAALAANGGVKIMGKGAPVAAGKGGAVEVCRFFAQTGWCKHGDNCNHVHTGQPTAGNPGGATGTSGEVCQFFAKAGWCKHGTNCNHVHAGAGAGGGGKGAPVAPPGKGLGGAGKAVGVKGNNATIGKGGVVKIGMPAADSLGNSGEICAFFAKAGWCKHEANCRHQHVADPSMAGTAGAPDPKRMKVVAPPGGKGKSLAPAQSSGDICQFFAKNGWCQHADNCRHIHADTGERVEVVPSGEPCAHFAKAGWCKFGDACKHTHDVMV